MKLNIFSTTADHQSISCLQWKSNKLVNCSQNLESRRFSSSRLLGNLGMCRLFMLDASSHLHNYEWFHRLFITRDKQTELFQYLPFNLTKTLIDCKTIKTVKKSYHRQNLTLSAQFNLIYRAPWTMKNTLPSAIKIVSWHLDSFCWFSCIRTMKINCRKKPEIIITAHHNTKIALTNFLSIPFWAWRAINSYLDRR
jgi:hypothetical protein